MDPRYFDMSNFQGPTPEEKQGFIDMLIENDLGVLALAVFALVVILTPLYFFAAGASQPRRGDYEPAPTPKPEPAKAPAPAPAPAVATAPAPIDPPPADPQSTPGAPNSDGDVGGKGDDDVSATEGNPGDNELDGGNGSEPPTDGE